jgi:hypothetical protein
MADRIRRKRLQIRLTPSEMRTVDKWRFDRLMPSRTAAVRELLRLGLATDDAEVTGSGLKSQDFGVTIGAKR